MNDNELLRLANARSGLDTISIFFSAITSFMFGTIITIGILCNFGHPDTLMQYIMICVLVPFFVITIIFVWTATIRDRILKNMKKANEGSQ